MARPERKTASDSTRDGEDSKRRGAAFAWLAHPAWRGPPGRACGGCGGLSPLRRLQQDQLLRRRLAQVADAQSEAPQRTRHQPLPPRQMTREPVDVLGFSDRVLDAELARQGREVAVCWLKVDG